MVCRQLYCRSWTTSRCFSSLSMIFMVSRTPHSCLSVRRMPNLASRVWLRLEVLCRGTVRPCSTSCCCECSVRGGCWWWWRPGREGAGPRWSVLVLSYHIISNRNETGTAQDNSPNPFHQTAGEVPLHSHCLPQDRYPSNQSEHEEVPYGQEIPLRLGEALFELAASHQFTLLYDSRKSTFEEKKVSALTPRYPCSSS